ncbi:MAG: DUF4129 domain-containing protein [Thermoplasmata archaeon]
MRPSSRNLLLFALVIVIAVAVLNLVQNLQALSSGGVAIDVPRIRILPVDLGLETTLVGVYVLSLAALGVFLLALYWVRPKVRKFPYQELLPIVVAILTLMAVVLLIQPFVEGPEGQPMAEGLQGEDDGMSLGQGAAIEEDSDTPAEPLQQAAPVAPRMLGLILALLAVAAVYLLLVMLRSRRSLSWAESVEQPQNVVSELTEALGERISRLRLGEDVRLTILGCYRDLVELLHSHGLTTPNYLTAREVESLALDSLRLSTESAEALRKLFEEARYSYHPMTQTHRKAALESLEQVRAELGT